MIKRYAYIVDNETLWGPGPMPYFITLKDKTMWEITAHKQEENEAVGVYEIEQVNYREYDERFEQANLPEYSIVKGKPRETWSYSFIPTAIENMLNAVDEHAEYLRTIISTKFPGQYSEYDQAYAEALEIMKLSPTAKISNKDYPYVAADIGITYSSILEREVKNIREAAGYIVRMREASKNFGANLRAARLITKKNIKSAKSPEDAQKIYNAFAATTIENYFDD